MCSLLLYLQEHDGQIVGFLVRRRSLYQKSADTIDVAQKVFVMYCSCNRSFGSAIYRR